LAIQEGEIMELRTRLGGAEREIMELLCKIADQEHEFDKLRAEATEIFTQDNTTFSEFQKQLDEESEAAQGARVEAAILREALREQEAKGENLRVESTRVCTQLREWAASDAAEYSRHVQSLQAELTQMRSQLALQEELESLRSELVVVEQASAAGASVEVLDAQCAAAKVEITPMTNAALMLQRLTETAVIPLQVKSPATSPYVSPRSTLVPPPLAFARQPSGITTRHSWPAAPRKGGSQEVAAALSQAVQASPPIIRRDATGRSPLVVTRDTRSPPVVSRELASPAATVRGSSPTRVLRTGSSSTFPFGSPALLAARTHSPSQSSRLSLRKVAATHQPAAISAQLPRNTASPQRQAASPPRLATSLRQPLPRASLEKSLPNAASVSSCSCPFCGCSVNQAAQNAGERSSAWSPQRSTRCITAQSLQSSRS